MWRILISGFRVKWPLSRCANPQYGGLCCATEWSADGALLVCGHYIPLSQICPQESYQDDNNGEDAKFNELHWGKQWKVKFGAKQVKHDTGDGNK
ncbi:hypothetical protein Harman_38780 [Haloarcula mannanilytica]|uniref:Uncharacterized protein n=1 Tax=Haloarcula mannanilytica TaxID=2509225 RepID=A0A4C2ETL2_9EURY|nr:hypothetical protein Harman_38780 [Haloarcula mannanilytica]